jgi:predicted nucleic acid-binding Zn ribbon protein
MTDPLAEIRSAIDAEHRAILAQADQDQKLLRECQAEKERARQHRQEYIFIILMILIMNLIVWIP